MSKFQGVLKMFMLGVLKTILKTVLKYEKTPSHFMAGVEIEQQILFVSFGFARVSEVRHIYALVQNLVCLIPTLSANMSQLVKDRFK